MAADESLPADSWPQYSRRSRVRGRHTPCLSGTAEQSRRYFGPTRPSRWVVSLTRTVLWLLSLGVLDKSYEGGRRCDRRALAPRSGPVYRGDVDGYISGHDGPGGSVAHARHFPHRAGSTRFVQASVTGVVKAVTATRAPEGEHHDFTSGRPDR